MRVGLTEHLDDHASGGVADEKHAGEHPGAAAYRLLAPEEKEQNAQHQAFEAGLVKLARMPRQWPAAREGHGPRHVCNPAEKLAVDEIRDASQEQADRRGAGQEVGE